MSARHWTLATEESVRKHFEFWRRKENGFNPVALNVGSEHHQPWAKKARAHRVEDVMVAHIAELNKQGARPGWIMGELRDGLVHPEKRAVRSQTSPTRGRLLQRFCRACRTLLSAGQFSHNGKPSGRTICKACDNTKRVERRKRARQLAKQTSLSGEQNKGGRIDDGGHQLPAFFVSEAL
jgi:hypothetical protein